MSAINNNSGATGVNQNLPSDFRDGNDNVSESDQDAFESAMFRDQATGTFVSKPEGYKLLESALIEAIENGEVKTTDDTSSLFSRQTN